MFHLMFSLPCLVVLVRWLWPLPVSGRTRLAGAVVLLLASQYHLWSRLSSGSVFSPEFPKFVVILFNWAFGAILLLAVFQLLLDVGALAVALARRRRAPIAVRLRIAIGIAAMLLAALGVMQAIKSPPLKDLQIEVRNLPPEFDGYRVLHLTDLHISRLFDAPWTRKVVDDANALGADLIVITGDLIDGNIAQREADVAPLRDLHAPDGVWVIPGNHEYFFGHREWMAYFAGLDMTPLDNSHAIIKRGAGQLVLAGVNDVTAPSTGAPAPDLDAALRGAPAGVPVVLLDHQPRNARFSASRGVALQLSGHTHGGMIVGLDRVVARANNGFVSGRYEVDGMTLYLNNGTALWPGFALRLGVPAELTRITLRRQAPRTAPSS
ncbi:metallophosphoesterase [Telluria beijingensis]|uniref:metallophosphoesterase n=1 Tax=Telluria beijingensis TaxID=3068633 RepID=UPI002795974B|nr:metallophosphoesterase [Massilia sp. REN29]